jgi:hypothetical protein
VGHQAAFLLYAVLANIAFFPTKIPKIHDTGSVLDIK